MTLVGMIALLHAAPTVPEPKQSSEYELKAAFLYNFAHFIEWPAEAFDAPVAPFVIGILGADPFGTSLDEIVARESIGDHELVVRRFPRLEDVEHCQILFVSRSERDHLDKIVTRLRGQRVLTVCDVKDFALRSGMIGFVMVRNHLRLQVNLGAAKDEQLRISSQLLRQAEIVATRGTGH